jgi:uncharacterized protein (DUF1499 family)
MSGRSRCGVPRPHWLTVLVLVTLSACAGKPALTSLENDRFAPCPQASGCVSSDAGDADHRVEPYRLTAPAQKAWHGLQNVLAAESGIRLIEVSDVYMHIEVESSVMRFVDDTEFHLRADEGIIAVRSAARDRSGGGEVNRERLERIRKELQKRGLVE